MDLELFRPRHRLQRLQEPHDLLRGEARTRRELGDRDPQRAQPAHRGDDAPGLEPGGFGDQGACGGKAPAPVARAFVPLQTEGADGVEAVGEDAGGEVEKGFLLVEAEFVVTVQDGDGLRVAGLGTDAGLMLRGGENGLPVALFCTAATGGGHRADVPAAVAPEEPIARGVRAPPVQKEALPMVDVYVVAAYDFDVDLSSQLEGKLGEER
ncbi:hypothetical protein MMC18_005654 [Xylographa bjoerkii]|nr:hypothetical protein [Xylographa bjoerkii]